MSLTYENIAPDLLLKLKNTYFGNKDNLMRLKSGEYLMRQNQENKRLFMVTNGMVAGYLTKNGEEKLELFRSDKNMIVGFHSFFSKSFSAYADVVALEDSSLLYLDYDELGKQEYKDILEDFVPVILHELSARQVFAKNIMQDKESALKRLFQRDKLATLGQMAAGLAHELNNAIGVIHGNADWVAKEILEYIKGNEREEVFDSFLRAYEKGQYLSSTEVRKEKRKIEKKFDLQPAAAKKLAKLGYSKNEVAKINKSSELNEITERLHYFWEMGVALHDTLLASKHAVYVLNSIKQLSASDRKKGEVSLNDTIEKALTLLKNIVRKVKVDYRLKGQITLIANAGELVQIWMNLIKNACESLVNSHAENPTVIIDASMQNNDTVKVEISDNGPGIPDDLVHKVFRPNFTTKKGGLTFGLGLGLSIVQKLVETYDGTIEVSSQKDRTIFTVVLPAC